MSARTRFVPGVVGGVLVFAIAARTLADGGTTPEAPAPQAAPAGIAVRIDIDETIDGQPSKYMMTSYFVRKKLREAGFAAWSARPIAEDEKERKKLEEEATKAGKTLPPALEETQPAPSLLVKGKSDLKFDHEITTFNNVRLGAVYSGYCELTLTDPEGNVIAKLADAAESGSVNEKDYETNKKEARNRCMKRLALFASATVLDSKAIQERLTDKVKEAVRAYIDKMNAEREKSRGTGQPGEKSGE